MYPNFHAEAVRSAVIWKEADPKAPQKLFQQMPSECSVAHIAETSHPRELGKREDLQQ